MSTGRRVVDKEPNYRIGCAAAPHCGGRDKKKKNKAKYANANATAAVAAAAAASAENKPVGLFLPFDDLRAMRRGHCAKVAQRHKAELDHARDVATDVSRLMQLAYTNNHQRWTEVQDPANLTTDMVRKLIILHLGEAHSAVWTGLHYNGQRLADLESEENLVATAFMAPDLVTEAQRLPTQVPAEFWHHLFEHLVFDYTVSQSGGNGNMVTFHKPESEVPVPNRDKRPNMDAFAPFYRKARTYGIEHKDVPFAFFVASALKKKNGLETLRVAFDGQGIDKEHARFANVSPSQLDNFFNQVVAKANYNQERTPAVMSEDVTLAQFVDDWISLLNYVDTSKLPDVGMVTQAMVTPDAEMILYSTEAGRQARLAQEQAEQNYEAPSIDTPASGEGEAAEGDDGDEEEEGDGDDEEEDTASIAHSIEFNHMRFQAMQELDLHPAVREARSKWKVQVPSDKLVGMLLTRQLTASRKEREQVLQSAMGFQRPEQYHELLEIPLHALDSSSSRMFNAQSWHGVMHHISAALKLPSTEALPDVDAFVKQVFGSPGVAASDRPVSPVEKVRRYLAVYAHGSDDPQAWKDVWRTRWTLSPVLEKAIDARLKAVPTVPLETQKAIVRAVLHQKTTTATT